RVSGAEGRFVFEFVNCPNASPDDSGSPRPFLFIIEYGVPIDTCPGMRSWAQQWEALSSLSITNPSTDPTFNNHLQALTDQFATANLDPTKPNGSALNQLRVNLLAMNILDGWSLREFHLETDGLLHLATVAQTPDSNYNQDFAPSGPLPPKL